MKFSSVINPLGEELHYFGWGYIINQLKKTLCIEENAPILHTFTDCIFWGDKDRALPLEPWLGFVHSAIKPQPGRQSGFCVDELINSQSFQNSLPYCKGLITLTNHTKNYLQSKLEVPVYHSCLPRKTEDIFFDIDSYFCKPILRHSGFELRDVSKFFTCKTSLKKDLYIGHMHNYELIVSELRFHGVSPKACGITPIYEFLSNKQYIKTLTSTIGFAHYYDCGASHSITEHIASHSPVVVNKIPPIVEYLGEDYPMYYENISYNLDQYLLDKKFIQETSDYLKQRSQKKEFTIEYFCESINNL